MRPPARAALGLLLGLLLGLPREASPKPTPCKRCRELVDKFNQVGRPGTGPGHPEGSGHPSGAGDTPYGPGHPFMGRGHPIWAQVTPEVALVTPRCTWSPHQGRGA